MLATEALTGTCGAWGHPYSTGSARRLMPWLGSPRGQREGNEGVGSLTQERAVLQSFGSPNKKHVGVILQRGTLVLLLCCFPCWALFLNTETILLLFRQDPAVSRYCLASAEKRGWEPLPSSPHPPRKTTP